MSFCVHGRDSSKYETSVVIIANGEVSNAKPDEIEEERSEFLDRFTPQPQLQGSIDCIEMGNIQYHESWWARWDRYMTAIEDAGLDLCSRESVADSLKGTHPEQRKGRSSNFLSDSLLTPKVMV